LSMVESYHRWAFTKTVDLYFTAPGRFPFCNS
jgi:hypothetical protein